MDPAKILTEAAIGEEDRGFAATRAEGGPTSPLPNRRWALGQWTWLVVASLATPSFALGQNAPNGPLTYEEGSPLQRVSHTAVTEGATVTPRGALVTDFSVGYSNIFEQDSSATHVLFIDMERLVTTVTARWGVGDGIEVGGRLLFETTGAGALDGAILAWHKLLGFGQANRDRFPEGAYAQRLSDGGATRYLDTPRRTLGLEDVRLFAKIALAGDDLGGHALALKVETRLPTGADPLVSERPDVALMALGRLGLGSWYLHAVLGGATLRAPPELAGILRDRSAFFAFAVERSFGTRSAVVQFQVQSAVLDTFDHRELDRAPSNLVLGVAGRLGERWRWDASFQEDVPADTPAIDFTLGIRLSRTW